MPEENEWPEQIYTIATNDKLLGGKDGPLNKAAKQLDTRTAILKQSIDEIKTDLGSGQTGEKINKLEKEISDIKTDLGSGQTSAKINKLEKEVSDIKTDLSSGQTGTKISKLETDLNKTNTSLTNLSNDVVHKTKEGNISFPGTITAPNFFGGVDIYGSVADGAAAHNCFYRGKNLTESFNNGTMSANIANGTFKDIFPGDYIIKDWSVDGMTFTGMKWMIGHCDYYGTKGTPTQTHHVLVFPIIPVKDTKKYQMFTSSTADGGYLNSYIYKTVMPIYSASIGSLFGDHVLPYANWFSNGVNANVISSRGDGSLGGINSIAFINGITVSLFSMKMLFGNGINTSIGSENCYGYGQVAAFKFDGLDCYYETGWFWTLDVASIDSFYAACDSGFKNFSSLTESLLVRPYFLLK